MLIVMMLVVVLITIVGNGRDSDHKSRRSGDKDDDNE